MPPPSETVLSWVVLGATVSGSVAAIEGDDVGAGAAFQQVIAGPPCKGVDACIAAQQVVDRCLQLHLILFFDTVQT